MTWKPHGGDSQKDIFRLAFLSFKEIQTNWLFHILGGGPTHTHTLKKKMFARLKKSVLNLIVVVATRLLVFVKT